MAALAALDKLYISITVSEERIFRFDFNENFRKSFNQFFTAVAFAEENSEYLLGDQVAPKPEVCERVDARCFMDHNSPSDLNGSMFYFCRRKQ